MLAFFRSPYRDLERAERARLEGFVRPFYRRRVPLFTRALRFGALAYLGYRALRTAPGQRFTEGIRQRFPAPFEWYDRHIADVIENIAYRSVHEAYEHPNLQRERPILSAALSVRSAPYHLRETMRAFYVRRQMPFEMTTREPLRGIVQAMGYQSEQEAMDFIVRMEESGILDELFATRTRRRQLFTGFERGGYTETSIYQTLAQSRAFHSFRQRLQQEFQLSDQQLDDVLRRVITRSMYESMRASMAGTVLDTQSVTNELREFYRSALFQGELDRNPLAEQLIRRGYRPVSLYEALGFGYTVNDPELARALQFVHPDHYRYLDISLSLEQLPENLRALISRFRSESEDPQFDDPQRRRAFNEAWDKDPEMALARFLALRERHRESIVYRAYDLAGVERPTGERREGLFDLDPQFMDRDTGRPVIRGVHIDDYVIEELSAAQTRGMLINPRTGKIVDLTYVHPAAEYVLRDTSMFGIPMVPGMFSLQIMRMFPWFRPADDWLIHLDPTARQPVVAEALGRSRGDAIGSDVFIIGGKMYRMDPLLWDPYRNQTERDRSREPGTADAPSSFGGVTLEMTEVPGDWTAMRVRGMTMRGMMDSLIASAEQPQRSAWWQRWFHLGAQGERSWFGKFADSVFTDESDETNPRVVWQRFIEQMQSGQVDDRLADEVATLLSRVAYRIDFNEVEFARHFGRLMRSRLGELYEDPVTGVEGIFEWYELFEQLGENADIETALAAFLRNPRYATFRHALLAAVEPGIANDDITSLAMRLGLLSEASIGGQRLGEGVALSVQSDMLLNLLRMRSGLFRYISEPYTPDRPEHLFDPVPGALFGLPESKLRFAELIRAMMLESTMQYLQSRGDADIVLQTVIDAAREAGDERIATWFMASLLREYMDDPNQRGDVLSYLFSHAPRDVADAFNALHNEVLRQTSFPYVSEPVDDDVDPTNRASLFVLRRGPRFGSREWFAGYFSRWGRVESESDLYRYFVGWRLNEMLKPYGLGVDQSAMASGRDMFRELALYRLLPAIGGYMAWRYVNTEMRNLFGYAPADALADTLRLAQYGATAVMDVTGITRLKKFLVSEIPGLDVYFQPRNLRELQFYHRYGLTAVRYGRGWISGSRSAFAGEGVYANLPPWYRGMRSYWQAASNADIASPGAYTRGDIPLPTPRNPLAPVFYVFRKLTGIADRSWAERHRYDRPYPVAYVHTRDASPYALSGVHAEAVALRAGNAEPLLVRDVQEMPPARNYRHFMLAVGMSPRLREELVTPPGAESPMTVEQMPVTAGSPLVERTRFTIREIFHRLSEIQGLYGWLQRLVIDSFIGRENPVITESPGWAYSFSRRFWESLYGGIDILPWQNELNELLRRFVPKRRPTEYVYYNPIPNNMPYWIPERLRYGDPYVRIYAGELRLPGEAYRWANPARFGVRRPGPHDIRASDVLTLPATFIGAGRDEQFAALSGLGRAIGQVDELPDVVRRRVLRRYLQTLPDDTPVLTNIIARDRERHIASYTMLMHGEGRRATIVHPVSPYMQRDQAELAMMERMRELGVRRGLMLVVEDDRTGEYRAVPVRYDARRLERHLARWDETRELLFREIESGRLNEGLFYSPLQRLEVLADVAPKSPEFRRLRTLISSRMDMLTEEEKERYRYALEIAERTQERYHLYPYRNVQLESQRARLIALDEQGRLQVEGLDTPVRLAGLSLRIGAIKRRYGLPRTASAEEALARLSEEFGLTRGAEIELRHGGAGRGALRALVVVRGREINRELIRLGLASPDETDVSPAARRMRQGRLRRFFNWLIDTLTHADTPFHTKFLRVRSPLEEWERGHVFGTRAGSWESPFSSYIVPTITAIANKNPVRAALAGAALAAMFGYTTGAKQNLAVYGAIAGAGLSLLRNIVAPKGYIPASTRKRWEIDEYIDTLQYLKYMRLYRQEARLAKEREGIDLDRWLEDVQQKEREQVDRIERIRSRIERIQSQLVRRDDSRLREELNRLQTELSELEEQSQANRREKRRRRGIRARIASFYESMVRRLSRRNALLDADSTQALTRPEILGEHARRALLYRALAEQTATGTGVARTPGEALRTVRPYVKDIYRRILEEGTPREKRRFYDLLPDYQKLVFHDLLAPDAPLPRPPDPMRLFHRFGLPGPSWRGWDPDVDLELLRADLVERRGLDPVDAGVYPTERAVSRVVLDEIGVPLPISSTETVRARLASLLGEGGWQSVAGATVRSRIGGNYYVYVDYYDREYERNVYKHYVRAISGAS